MHTADESRVVALQLGRAPRDPWRTAVRCPFGYPSVIASPPVLADGDRFPTLAYLTCPWLAENAAAEESAGATAQWALRAAQDPELAEGLRSADAALRRLRTMESGGDDPCTDVGIAGQRDPLGVKCLHAHLALALIGVGDPIGRHLLGEWGRACPDCRCEQLLAVGEGERA